MLWMCYEIVWYRKNDRRFIKKKTDIALVTDATLNTIHKWFNDYPREIIGFKTSNELELKELMNSCTT